MRTFALAAALAAAVGCGGGSSGGGGGGGGMTGGDGGGGPYGGGGGGGMTGCTATSATATNTVSMQGMAFVPPCVLISKGETVSFTNADTMQHTVSTDASQPEAFDSGLISPGAPAFRHAFASTAETVHVHCNVHSTMHLTVIVE
jgi:plastocyanin